MFKKLKTKNDNFLEFLKQFSKKWVAVGGNRWIDKETSKKIGFMVRKLIISKCKIVTGGAEGADHVVMKYCLKYRVPKNYIKIFLPYDIQKQYSHYRRIEKSKKARILLRTLLKIKKRYQHAIIENKKIFKNYRKAANFRNTLIVNQADAAVLFKTRRSTGTLDAFNKIKKKKISYLIFE